MSQTIELGNEKFSTFLTLLETIGVECTDCCIRGGLIGQVSDKKQSIYRTNVGDIIGDINISIIGLSSKVELLEPFRKQQSEMSLTLKDKTYIFHDTHSEIEMNKPKDQFLTNKYLESSDLDKKLQNDGNGRIFGATIPKWMIDRVNALAKGLAAQALRIDFKDGKAIFKITSNDQQCITVGKFMTVNLEREIEGFCIFPIESFVSGKHDQLEVDLFFKDDNGNLILRLVSMLGNENASVELEVWCLSILTK